MERGCFEDQPQQVKGLGISRKFKSAAAGRGRHSRAPAFSKYALHGAQYSESTLAGALASRNSAHASGY
jgi:hypothetical protein